MHSVQILRAVAALLVLVGHAGHEAVVIADRTGQVAPDLGFFDWGFGVDIFFVISGFIMLYSSADKFGVAGAPREFLLRRLMRIAPLYWLLTAAMLAGAAVAPSLLNVPIESLRAVIESFFFIPGLRANGEVRPLLALGWTLNYEMFFYAAFAACLLLPRRWGLLALFTGFVAFVALGWLVRMPTTALAFWADSIILEFLFGMAIALVLRTGLRFGSVAALGLFLFGAALAAAGGPLWGVNEILPRCVAGGIPAAMIVFAAACGPRLPTTRWIAPLILLGDASYSLYLSHPFVIRPLRNIWMALPTHSLPVGWYIAFACAVAAVAAVAVYWLIERPMTKRLTRLVVRQPPARWQAASQPVG
ncbi:MAG: acyltransferase [Pseudorhodoplanes sp.]